MVQFLCLQEPTEKLGPHVKQSIYQPSNIKPLDCYFFRQGKYFKQKLYDRVAIDQIDMDICSRNSILKMHSLIHNQLAAKTFLLLIKYARYSSGYASKDPGHFENVQDVCFSFDKDFCSMLACNDCSFICCSHCHRLLCFNHFFIHDYKH